MRNESQSSLSNEAFQIAFFPLPSQTFLPGSQSSLSNEAFQIKELLLLNKEELKNVSILS